MSRCWTFFLTTMLQQPNLFFFMLLFVCFFNSRVSQVFFFWVSGFQCPPRWKMSLLMLEAKRETQRHPLHASSPLRLPEKLVREAAVLRYWPWREATQLPHRMLPRSHTCINFFILISVYAVFPPRRTGPWSGTTSSQKEDGGHGG